MPFDLHLHPGHYFVVATLLPLASFVLILLASAVWAALRPYQRSATLRPIFELFGGEDEERPGRGQWSAWTATAAIAIAFLLCLSGAVQYFSGHEKDEKDKKQLEENIAGLHKKLHELKDNGPAQEFLEQGKKLEEEETALAKLESKWNGHWDWLQINPVNTKDDKSGNFLRVGFHIDSLSVVMFVMVTFIATLIHLFSIGYMSDEMQPMVEDHHVHSAHGHFQRRGRFGRFFLYLSLFCFSMLNLILADNLFQVFLSWELVGICSYLLVGFYYERQSASNAANKAFITNRVGDAGFIIGLLILFTYVGTLNFQEVFTRIRSPLDSPQGKLETGGQFVRGNPLEDTPATGERSLKIDPRGSEVLVYPRVIDEDFHGVGEGLNDPATVHSSPKADQYGSMPYWMLVVAGLGIFLGCVGKSAQFPLQVWLPDAMEGPTPVSALIHAATMVAAGVYLVGRCYPLFTPEALLIIAYIGAITLFVAATTAVVMTDIKKVLAYSTVSQLGYMMLALGVGGWAAGLFHLVTHAFFKALLFLGSGSVIYGCHHEQDMMKMGGLYKKMRITALTMLVGVLAIAGIPLFSGWYSKDAVLSAAIGYVVVHKEHALLFILPLVTAGLTTFYMFRMWLLTFTGQPRDQHVYDHAHESPPLMTAPLILLAIGSVFVAWPAVAGEHRSVPWNAEASWLEAQIHHAQPVSVIADFGVVPAAGEGWDGPHKAEEKRERYWAHEHAHTAGNLALLLVNIGILFAFLLYYFRAMDPAEAKESFPGVHTFLMHKWYFDELYSAILVRPVLVVAHWLKAFDLKVIDGFLHGVAGATVWVSKWDGIFDRNIIDGLVNVIGNTTHAVGAGLRRMQTGFLRSYVLFLVLAAVGIFVALAAM